MPKQPVVGGYGQPNGCQGVQWEAVDNAAAKATLKDEETTLTMLFRFNENGLIKSARSETRGRIVACHDRQARVCCPADSTCPSAPFEVD